MYLCWECILKVHRWIQVTQFTRPQLVLYLLFPATTENTRTHTHTHTNLPTHTHTQLYTHTCIYMLVKFGWRPSWMHISLECMPFFILIIHLLFFFYATNLFFKTSLFNRNKVDLNLRSEGSIKVDKNELENLVK